MTSLKREKALRELLTVTRTLLIPMVLLVVALAAIVAEHARRVEVARSGVPAVATVTESLRMLKGCRFTYVLEVHGRRYEGGDGGCGLVEQYGPGRPIGIRYDPGDPNRSNAPGMDLWPDWTFTVVILIILLASFEAIFIYGVPRRPRRRKRASKSADSPRER